MLQCFQCIVNVAVFPVHSECCSVSSAVFPVPSTELNGLTCFLGFECRLGAVSCRNVE